MGSIEILLTLGTIVVSGNEILKSFLIEGAYWLRKISEYIRVLEV